MRPRWRARPGGCAPPGTPPGRERAEARGPVSGPGGAGGSPGAPPRQTGDAVTLPGRGGTKTLKKLFIDEKVPRRERERIPVLADGRGVAAVAGFGPEQSRTAVPGQAAYELLFWKKE
ncbi:MAG: tRNA lysidine(34) synthetase TilS [Flavonifractor plautii]